MGNANTSSPSKHLVKTIGGGFCSVAPADGNVIQPHTEWEFITIEIACWSLKIILQGSYWCLNLQIVARLKPRQLCTVYLLVWNMFHLKCSSFYFIWFAVSFSIMCTELKVMENLHFKWKYQKPCKRVLKFKISQTQPLESIQKPEYP